MVNLFRLKIEGIGLFIFMASHSKMFFPNKNLGNKNLIRQLFDLL